MKETLDKLSQLQEIDSRIHQTAQLKEEFPEKLTELKTTIEKARLNRDGIQKKLIDIDSDKKQAEAEVHTEKELFAKSQERLTSIKTNREYDAVHEEIEIHKSKTKTGEDRIIALMEEQEKVTKELEEAEQKLKEVEDLNTPAIKEIETEVATVDQKIDSIRAERDRVAKTLDKQALRTYERILKSRKNAKVIGFISPDQRSCSFCYKALSFKQVNEIRRQDELITCDSCGSLLIWMEKKNG